jgi:serine/threonine protein kinase
MGNHKSDWEQVDEEPIGEGGQSKVYRVRTPERTDERKQTRDAIKNYVWINASTNEFTLHESRLRYAEAIRRYTRDDLPEELGAMKEFKLRNDEQQSLRRLQQEIDVLQQKRPGLPKLLGSNISERWMVTELFSNGTLENHLADYKGDPELALKVFRSLVHTVSLLHKDDIVHRDIKPANIFVTKDHQLILGDFGLVYVPDHPPRMTASGETVGAGDFIPPWGDMGRRLENVKPNVDVYMLGKVLWCMVTGNPVLKREYFRERENDVTKLFPGDPHSYMINVLLDRTVVERQERCFSSAFDLLTAVDSNIETIKRGGQLLNAGIPRICRVCGVGHYIHQTPASNQTSDHFFLNLYGGHGTVPALTMNVGVWTCDTCQHIQFFERT